MDNEETSVELWYVYGCKNHPGHQRHFCGIFDSEEKAKEVTKTMNEYKRAGGFRGRMFDYRYTSTTLNSVSWDYI